MEDMGGGGNHRRGPGYGRGIARHEDTGVHSFTNSLNHWWE